jgi:hypothetical protein
VFTVKLYLFFKLALLAYLHPVHVSVTNFEYVSKDKVATMSVKVFKDDFELAFIHNYNLTLNLGTDSIHPEWKKYVDTYFSKIFSLKANNKTIIPLVLQNYEMTEDGVMLFFKAPIKEKVKTLQIENAILMDTFENQTNLLITSINGKEKGHNLNYNNYKISLKL